MRLLYTAIRRNRGSGLRQRCGHGSPLPPGAMRPCGRSIMAGICVWISSLPSTKIEVSASAAEADYKTKVSLNREAEFVRCARLAGDGGSYYDDSILAIAHIEPAFIYNSLDLLDDAQTSQYRFWRRFAGAPLDFSGCVCVSSRRTTT